MKLSKREKEIVTALRDGARLWPPGFMSHQWQIRGLPVTSDIGEWVYTATIEKMKKRGLLIFEVKDGRNWRVPSTLALLAVEPRR